MESSTAPVSDLTALPVVLRVTELARILRRSVGAIRRECAAGHFRPRPAWTRPYRWVRNDVVRYLDTVTNTAERPAAAPLAPNPPRTRGRLVGR